MTIYSGDIGPLLTNYAHGGHTRKKGRRAKYELVHMNRHEINDLNAAQGFAEKYKGTDSIHTFDHLAEILRNPKIVAHLKEHVDHHYANGGRVDIERQVQHFKRMGRHGDTQAALIPHDMVELLDHLSGHRSINPDGHREYFLGQPMMDGIKRFFNPVGQAFKKAGTDIYNTGRSAVDTLRNKTLPAVGRGLQDIYKTATTPDATGMSPLGRGALGMATGLLTGNPIGAALSMGALAGTQGVPGTFSQGLNSAAGAYMGGASPQQAALRGFQDFSSQYDNPYGRMGSAFSGSQLRGENMYDSMGRTAMGGMEGFDNPYARFGRGAVDEYMTSRNPSRAMARGTLGATEGMSNPYAAAARGGAEAHLGGADYRESARRGALAGIQHMNRGAQQGEDSPYYY
jgi:hypothetical protein